jgi:hypothetical protein
MMPSWSRGRKCCTNIEDPHWTCVKLERHDAELAQPCRNCEFGFSSLKIFSYQLKHHACTQDKRRSFPLFFICNEPGLDERHAFAQLQDILFASLPPLPESEAEQP